MLFTLSRMPRQKPMPSEERAICQRLREFRLKTGLSQAQFAVLVGLNWRAYAGFEYARTQLNYPSAWKILSFFWMLNPLWLVEGSGKMVEKRDFIFPIAEQADIGKRALFSTVFTSRFRSAFLRSPILRTINSGLPVQLFGADSTSKGRLFNVERFSDLILDWIVQLPDEKVSIFLNELFLYDAKVFAKYSHDQDEELVARRKSEIRQIVLNRHPSEKKDDSLKNDLTKKANPAKDEAVQNHWHRLKQRLQKVTESPGTKSALAKFLGVDLTQLSRWLTDAKTAREPGADYTLKMLHWVQEREGQ